MKIEDILSEELVLPDLNARSKVDVLVELATAIGKFIAPLQWGTPPKAIGTYGEDLKIGEWTPENMKTGVNMVQTMVRGDTAPRMPTEVFSRVRITVSRRDVTLKLVRRPVRAIIDVLANQPQIPGYKTTFELEGVPSRYRNENDRMIEYVSFMVQAVPLFSYFEAYTEEDRI